MITAEKAQAVEFVGVVLLVAYTDSYMHSVLLSQMILSTAVAHMMILSVPAEAALVSVVALVSLVAMLFLPVLFLVTCSRTHYIRLRISVNHRLRDSLECSLHQ